MNLARSIPLNPIASSFLNMRTMGERLQEALDRRGRKPPEVILGTGLAKGTIYNILNDTTKPEKVWADTATKICRFLGISRDWLLFERGSMDAPVAVDDSSWENVRATAQGVSLGGGMSPDDYAETHRLKFLASSLRSQGLDARHLEVYYGRGDSMEPTIKDGDAILVNKAETRILDEKLYFIRHEGHFFVKRLQLHGDLVFIVSDNRDDPQWRKPVLVKDSDDFEVLGRVRWIGSWAE